MTLPRRKVRHDDCFSMVDKFGRRLLPGTIPRWVRLAKKDYLPVFFSEGLLAD